MPATGHGEPQTTQRIFIRTMWYWKNFVGTVDATGAGGTHIKGKNRVRELLVTEHYTRHAADVAPFD